MYIIRIYFFDKQCDLILINDIIYENKINIITIENTFIFKLFFIKIKNKNIYINKKVVTFSLFCKYLQKVKK